MRFVSKVPVFVLLLLLTLGTVHSYGQVTAAARGGGNQANAFGMFTFNQPDYGTLVGPMGAPLARTTVLEIGLLANLRSRRGSALYPGGPTLVNTHTCSALNTICAADVSALTLIFISGFQTSPTRRGKQRRTTFRRRQLSNDSCPDKQSHGICL